MATKAKAKKESSASAPTRETLAETLPAVAMEHHHLPAVASDTGIVSPLLDGAAMSGAISKYKEIQKALDESMPDQIMEIQGKMFRKKGYWRSLSIAFALKSECLKEEKITSEVDGDWGYIVTYRATAPNGSFADGDGACMASEKNIGRMEATEHNVRSHAHTRAYNRAISNLVGFGEVSAEEMQHAFSGSKQSESKWQGQRQGQQQVKIVCPECGKDAIIKDKFKGGYLCWPKKDGCGSNFPESQFAAQQPKEASVDPEVKLLGAKIKKLAEKNLEKLLDFFPAVKADGRASDEVIKDLCRHLLKGATSELVKDAAGAQIGVESLTDYRLTKQIASAANRKIEEVIEEYGFMMD